MVLFHKDFANEVLEMKDFWEIFGIDEETAKSGNVEKVEDEELATINRSKMKALLMSEEMGAELTIEEENNEIRITVDIKR